MREFTRIECHEIAILDDKGRERIRLAGSAGKCGPRVELFNKTGIPRVVICLEEMHDRAICSIFRHDGTMAVGMGAQEGAAGVNIWSQDAIDRIDLEVGGPLGPVIRKTDPDGISHSI